METSLSHNFSELTKLNLQREEQGWDIYDSGLVTGEHPLEHDFAQLYPNRYKNIREYLEQRFVNKKGKVTGLEIGGLGSRIFSDFKNNFLARSVGLTLTDSRDERQRKEDSRRNHNVLKGDAFLPETYKVLAEKYLPNGADIIFERMENGLLGMTENPTVFFELVKQWYKILSENGVMFVQSPYITKKENVEQWQDFLETGLPEIIPACSSSYEFQGGRFYVRIDKGSVN
jgi:hypothetical protein